MKLRLFPHLAPIALALALTTAACSSRTDLRRDRFDVRLHAEVGGIGTPTVVMDAGLGETLDAWNWIWRDVTRITRAVRYDRAGLGRSRPTGRPRTSATVIDELDRFLRRSGIDGPLVLVGHSAGGLNMRLFAARHPDRVVGLLLIDPTPIEFALVRGGAETESDWIRMQTALSLGEPGARAEFDAIGRSALQVANAPLPPDLPVIVLCSPRPGDDPEFRARWLEMQRRLAIRVRAFRHEIVEGSSHHIQFDEPARVVEAIRTLVERSRARGAGEP